MTRSFAQLRAVDTTGNVRTYTSLAMLYQQANDAGMHSQDPIPAAGCLLCGEAVLNTVKACTKILLYFSTKLSQCIALHCLRTRCDWVLTCFMADAQAACSSEFAHMYSMSACMANKLFQGKLQEGVTSTERVPEPLQGQLHHQHPCHVP